MCVRRTATFFLAVAIAVTAFVEARAADPAWAKVSPEQVAAAKKLGVPVAFENPAGMKFVLIPAGKFKMGSNQTAAEVAAGCNMPNAQPGWFHDEHPSHEVTLSEAFYLAIHELTQGCHQAVTNPEPDKNKEKEKKPDTYPAEFKGKEMPIGNVSCNDMQKFCQQMGAMEGDGRKYTLPTEAQWEYACRAGTTTPFAFGKTISTDQGNYHGDYTYGDGKKGKNPEKPLPVGSLAPNPWGLYDMHGNVSEACSSRYGKYSSAAETDPVGPTEGNSRVLRGGSWRSYPGACRSAFRLNTDQNARSYNVGFRLCCPLPVEESAEEDEKK